MEGSNFFENFLNSFSRPFTSAGGRSTRFIVVAIAVVAILLCGWATIVRIPQKFVFMADSMTFNDATSISIGENSDLNFHGVPHDYITVSADGNGGAHWTIGKQHRDTLQYFKINNVNPNAHDVLNSSSQEIVIHIPTTTRRGIDTTLTVSIKGSEVWEEWSRFSRQSDVMARHLVVRHLLPKAAEAGSAPDSATLMRQLDNGHIRSFFHCEHGALGRIAGIRLVILDSATTIDGTGYTYSGDIDTQHCKVQFYNVTNYCYADGSGSKQFQIGDVNYVMKPIVRLTEWGAGHVMLRFDAKKRIDVMLPKGIGYVGTVDSLRSYAENSSNVITFRQSSQSYPTNSDIFLPYFSHNANQDLFNLKFSTEGNVLTVTDGNNTPTVVSNPSSLTQFIPALRKVALKSGSTEVHARIGFIDTPFILRYILLSFLVLVLLLAITLGPWSPLRNDECRGLYAQDEISSLPAYVATLLVVVFAFCVCKSMIALKLSYSYPYFEKLTVITPFNCAMLLLVAFTLMLIANSGLTTYRPRARRRNASGSMSRWGVWGMLVAMAGGLCYTLFFMSDPQIAADVKASYLPHEINFAANWLTPTAYGTLDNHRTVCYTLIVVEGLLLLILAMAYSVGTEWITKPITSIGKTIVRCFPASFSHRAATLWDDVISGAPMPFLARLTLPPSGENRGGMPTARNAKTKDAMRTFWNDAISHIPAALVLLAIVLLMAIFGGSSLLTYIVLGVLLLVLFVDFVHDAFLATLRDLFPSHIIIICCLFFLGSRMGNFGTAFITLTVILGLTNALSRVQFTDPNHAGAASLPRHVVFVEMLFISLFYMGAAMVADNGYLTNYLGFIMAVLCFYFVRQRPGHSGRRLDAADRREYTWVRRSLAAVALLVVLLPGICSHLVDPEEVNYSRMTRRVMLFSNFGDLQKVGYRYAESDSEFMVVMSHYMQMADGGDPLSNDTHFLHASVSTGQSPVVLNDLSMPVAFFGSYGLWITTAVYFLLIFALLMLVFSYTFANVPHRANVFLTRPMQWRLLAVMMWAGTSLYIYFSYLGVLPFTGRLNPGYGVDAVGEALETAVLLAFMAVTTVRKPETLAAQPGTESKEAKSEETTD